MPSRFAVVPRPWRPVEGDVFETDPTYVLHFTNAFEDGDEIVLDGFFQHNPSPSTRARSRWRRRIPLAGPGRLRVPGCIAGGFNLTTGKATEEQLSDGFTEFVWSTGCRHQGLPLHLRRPPVNPAGSSSTAWSSTTSRPAPRSESPSARVFGSETPMAPRVGSTGEDDGYLVTFTIDMNETPPTAWCSTPPAQRRAGVQAAPAGTICSGTHSTWMAGSELR